MTKLIIIQAAFAALCILESFHDAAVISIQDYRLPHYETASKLWHKYSAWYVTGVAMSFAWLCECWWLLPVLLGIRLAVFNPLLNVIRDKDFFYLSDKGLDGLFIKVLGKHAGIIVWAGSVGFILLINLIMYGYSK